MISILELENEVKCQVTSLKNGNSYFEVKEELSIRYGSKLSLQIAQKAFKRYKYAKVKKYIILLHE